MVANTSLMKQKPIRVRKYQRSILERKRRDHHLRGLQLFLRDSMHVPLPEYLLSRKKTERRPARVEIQLISPCHSFRTTISPQAPSPSLPASFPANWPGVICLGLAHIVFAHLQRWLTLLPDRDNSLWMAITPVNVRPYIRPRLETVSLRPSSATCFTNVSGMSQYHRKFRGVGK